MQYAASPGAGSGYVQQWNVAVQRAVTNNLSIDIAYVGSHIVHVGIPDSNLNQLTTAQLAQGSSLLTSVTNPYFGQIPASSSIGFRAEMFDITNTPAFAQPNGSFGSAAFASITASACA